MSILIRVHYIFVLSTIGAKTKSGTTKHFSIDKVVKLKILGYLHKKVGMNTKPDFNGDLFLLDLNHLMILNKKNYSYRNYREYCQSYD